MSLQYVMTNIFSPFPTVAEAVQTELDQYRALEDEVKRLKGALVNELRMRLFGVF